MGTIMRATHCSGCFSRALTLSLLSLGLHWAGMPLTLHAATAPKAKAVAPASKPAGPATPASPDAAQTAAAKALKSVVVVSHFGREGKSDGIGTGFVVSSDGLIATSLHVIGEGRPITLQSADGRKLEVTEVNAWDRRYDLALLRVRERDLPPLALGDSDTLKPGQEMVAVGNPMGYENSVVRGVFSARRPIEGVDMLQVAMPIEPGNSGGPLLDLEGRVHGVVALKSLMAANIGFAVPINALRKLLARPSPVPFDRWMNMDSLNASEWEPLFGARWRQRVDRIVVEGTGDGFGGRSLCLSKATPPPAPPFEMAVSVKLDDEGGAAGLAFAADGADRHYGFYPTGGQLRLTRFDGPDVYAWTILKQGPSEHYIRGGWNRIKVRVETGRVVCFVNGRQVFESDDHQFAGARVGLCKFRNTQADFRDFVVGAAVDASEAPLQESLLTQLQDYLKSRDRAKEGELTKAFQSQSEAGRRYLTERARELEQEAGELRRLAQVTHLRRIEADLKDTLTAAETEIDLVRAALLIAELDDPELRSAPFRRHIDGMARELSAQIPPDADEVARLKALKRYFFDQQGFHGSREEYHDKANSYLNLVMEHREGIPITLSVLFLELGHRVGLPSLRPHPLPGHFMIAAKFGDGSDRVIDVYEGGRELTHAEADLVVGQFSQGEVKSELLEPAKKREVIVRMVRNLLGVAKEDGSDAAALKYLDVILAIQPNSPLDRLDRARLRARLSDGIGAREDIQWLLDHSPPGFDPDRLEELLRSL
jgi:regulator of sirC expression with transglutaminase-like and TPR domain